MKIDKSNPRHWGLLALEGLYCLLALLVRAVTPRPRIPRVIFYGHQYCGNIMALYEHARRDGDTTIEYYCLFLDPGAASAASELGVRVLRGYRLADMLTVARAAAIVSDHGLHALFPLKQFTDITFIDVWHGIPFKGFKPADFALQHTYDEVWVSSPLLQKLYCEKLGFRHAIVHPMGYARADKLFANTPPANSFKALHDIDSGKRMVLYAPTWEHEDKSRSQMPFGETVETFFTPLVEACRQNNALLVVRSHLNTRIPDTNLADVVFCPMSEFPDTESLLQETDLLICDWSSIAFDFLATQRPTVFLDVKPPFKEGYTLGPEYRFGAVVDSMQALERQVSQALCSPQDYWREYAERHRSVTEAVYGDNTDGQVAQRQIQRLKHLAENQ